MCKEGQSGRYSLPMESGEGAMEASSVLKTISSESWVKGKINTGGVGYEHCDMVGMTETRLWRDVKVMLEFRFELAGNQYP